MHRMMLKKFLHLSILTNSEMEKINAIYSGSNKRQSLYDLYIPENFNEDLIVFIHGYMGFKDWGPWNLLANHFINHGFGFCKFNMTHNGGTTQNPIDFPDLEAFANNTYSKEVNDLNFILQEIQHTLPVLPRIHLLGHSRGGGIGLLCANHPLVSSVITLAGISSVSSRFSNEEMLREWKKTGVRYLQNQRTKQQMPHNYVQYLDFIEFKDLLDIQKACENLDKPNLVIHGNKDTSVDISEGEAIATWTKSPLYTIDGADHTFGGSHPWNSDSLPTALIEVVTLVCTFIEKQNQHLKKEENHVFLDQIIQLSDLSEETKSMDLEFLLQIAQQLGLTKSDLIEQFEKSLSNKPHPSEESRILQFYRLCLLMFTEGEIEENDLDELRNAGLRMGLNPAATEEVLIILQNKDVKSIAKETLFKLFKTSNN